MFYLLRSLFFTSLYLDWPAYSILQYFSCIFMTELLVYLPANVFIFNFPGVHYWYNTSQDMSCNDFYPMFLLYNDGVLNAFGWAFGMNLESSERFEHPPESSYDVSCNYSFVLRSCRMNLLKCSGT